MQKIVLISCVSKKVSCKAQAKDIYISTLFKYNLSYAQSLHPDKIFILSAKYGLLELNQEIEPYDKTLNSMSESENKQWAENVLTQLKEKADLNKDQFIFLAGKKYRKNLIPSITNYEVPMESLKIGEQLQYLKQKTSNQ